MKKRKAKVNYMEFIALRNVIQTEGTLAWAIEFYLTDMAQMGKPVGESQAYTMRATQWSALGPKAVADLEEEDFLRFCKDRRNGEGVAAATVNHDLSNMRVVLKYVRSARKSCRNFTAALTALEAVQPMLFKLGLDGKSIPRTARTTDEQDEALKAYFLTDNGTPRRIPMCNLIDCAKISSRRLGELCRITIEDIDWEGGTYWVRDVKHPTKKIGNHKQFALFPEIAEAFRAQAGERTTGRLFPIVVKSASAAFTKAKKALGFHEVRFHDYRAKAIGYWLQKMTKDQVADLVSGHENTIMIDKTYDRRGMGELMVNVAHLMTPAAEQRIAA